ncbi:outer membrane beta-barrel protein [Sphingobacterium sp. LRF_L2]|uniref:outer membrane beta-barrel protein n=1 Tax=Sphingobacterium sp. LRF_L2 TaxID=3369421 RepID=UPI003F61BB9C
MKKFLTWVGIFLFLQQSNGYGQELKYKFGVGADFNLPTYQIDVNKNGTAREADYNWGWAVNGVVEVSAYRFFGLQTGITLKSIGATLKYSEFGKTTIDQKTYWAEIPLNLLFKLPLGDADRFMYLSAGPYAAIGLWGTNNFSDSYSGTTAKFTFGETQRRFDYGVNAEIGFQLNARWRAGVGYQMGIQDALSSDRYDQRNRAWKASLKYYLKPKNAEK